MEGKIDRCKERDRWKERETDGREDRQTDDRKDIQMDIWML